jgi:hypothetical protein
VIQVSFGETLLKAPETPAYVDVALRLLEARRRELAQGRQDQPSSDSQGYHTAHLPSSAVPSRPVATPPPPRRGRWFVSQLPSVQQPDGSRVVLRSLEELREFLRARGLAPHPRGDASVLLWQVRNRLRLPVEAVPYTNPRS